MHGARLMTTAKHLRQADYYPIALFAIFLCVLLLRCWPRVISPQVWAEDGLLVLSGFIERGWEAFFEPVNGYWQLIGKSISALSLGISVFYYPLLSAVLSCVFAVLVGLAVALSPTVLRGRLFCALALFLVPTNPEVFGLPLYAFWWAAVLLFLLVLWDEKHANIGWRTLFLLVGGLSSPVIVLIAPILYWRALRYRQARGERWLAALATATVLLQLSYILGGSAAAYPSLGALAVHVPPKFLGGFLVGNLGVATVWMWLGSAALVACWLAWLWRDVVHSGRWVLSYLLVGTIALSVIRIDPAVLTYVAGARYFFYSGILLAWILIQLYCADIPWLLRGAVLALAALALLNLLPVLTRYHHDLQWQAHVRSCRLFPEYRIPVEVDGTQAVPGWEIHLRGDSCAALLQRDLLVSPPELALPTFPYTAQRADWARRDESAEIVADTMTGRDFPRQPAPGYRIVGSWENRSSAQRAAPGVEELQLRLKKGASILYRSGKDRTGQRILIDGHGQRFLDAVPATSAWVRLTFASSELPAEFIVRIQDAGGGGEQWSAVALPVPMESAAP